MGTYERLKSFLTNEMRQSHIYQPVMLKELLAKGGISRTADIAQAILSHDPTQIEYYSQEELTRLIDLLSSRESR